MDKVFIRYVLRDGGEHHHPVDGDHEYADRLAKLIARDPQVARAEAIVEGPVVGSPAVA